MTLVSANVKPCSFARKRHGEFMKGVPCVSGMRVFNTHAYGCQTCRGASCTSLCAHLCHVKFGQLEVPYNVYVVEITRQLLRDLQISGISGHTLARHGCWYLEILSTP
jgi:hypothetical protein